MYQQDNLDLGKDHYALPTYWASTVGYDIIWKKKDWVDFIYLEKEKNRLPFL